MADKNVTATQDSILTDDRAQIARLAACEIDGIGKLLLNSELDAEEIDVTRTLLRRMRALANIQLSALGDPNESVESIEGRMMEDEGAPAVTDERHSKIEEGAAQKAVPLEGWPTEAEAVDDLWSVRALAKALHDSMHFDELNAERRILRVIDERLEMIQKTLV